MNIKVRRNTLILGDLYYYYLPNICFNSFLNRLETYGYELEKNKSTISGIFNKSDVLSLILISTYLISKLDPSKKPQIYKINIKYLNLVFNFLRNKYLFRKDDIYEIVYNDIVVINDFILNNIKISEYSTHYIPSNISEIVDRIDEINKTCNLYNSTSMVTRNLVYNNDNEYRECLLMLNAKEIMTHPIINLDINCSNRLQYSYLSHNYLRKYIYQSFIYDYEEYKSYNFVFEISNCFNLESYITFKHIFISVHKSSLINLINLIKYTKLSYRPFIFNGNLYNINSMCRVIGKYIEYKYHKCLEVYVNKIKPFYVTFIANKTYDFNIINFCDSEIILIYMLCIRVEFVEIVDVYKIKYTIRIYTCLSYNRIVNILKRIFSDRLTC